MPDYTEPPEASGRAVVATVVEILPSGAYRLELENREQVIAHPTRATEANFVRLRHREQVLVERTAGDPGRGRIVKVLKKG